MVEFGTETPPMLISSKTAMEGSTMDWGHSAEDERVTSFLLVLVSLIEIYMLPRLICPSREDTSIHRPL